MIALGMCSLGEIENIVNLVPQKFRHNVTLLHCVSLYPPKDEYVNLNFIKTLKQNFGLPVGFSDHTIGTAIPLGAIANGADVIEKHFTLDKNMPGWDHKVSANPEEMRIICEDGKRIIDAMGDGMKVVSEAELNKRLAFRRGLVTKHALKAGHELVYDDFMFKRPGTGISADRLNEVIGRHVAHDMEADKTIFWEDLVK
jgi:N-acetylneuraminate synthase